MIEQIKPSLTVEEASKYKGKFVRVFFKQKVGNPVFLGFKIDGVDENKLTVIFTDGMKKTYAANTGQFVTEDGYGLFLDSVT